MMLLRYDSDPLKWVKSLAGPKHFSRTWLRTLVSVAKGSANCQIRRRSLAKGKLNVNTLQTQHSNNRSLKSIMDSFITVSFQNNLNLAAAVLCIVYSIVLVLAPHKARDLYVKQAPEFKDPEFSWKVVDHITRFSSLCILMCGVCWWLVVMEGVSREKAIGVVSLMGVVHNLHTLLNDIPKQLNMSPRSTVINIMVFSAVAYATLGNTDFANLASKIVACFGLANGLLLFANPGFLEILYNIPDRESFGMLCRRDAGNNLISLSVYLCGLAWDLPQIKACGLSWASVGIGLVLLLPEMKKHHGNLTRIGAWILFMGFSAVVFLARVPEEKDTTESTQEASATL